MLPLLVVSLSLEASTATAGALCVGGGTPTEVMELAELMQVMLAAVCGRVTAVGGSVARQIDVLCVHRWTLQRSAVVSQLVAASPG